MLSGPLVLKTDGGTGCLAKEAESFEFWQEMQERGICILLRLPNGTLEMQEMDQAHSVFKPECQKSTI